MKKIIITIVLAILLTASMSWAAAPGTCTQSFAEVYSASGPTPLATLTFTCTASAENATFPSTATTQTITDQIAGRYILEVRTNPGATAPQALYDIAINDTDGIDLMGGSLENRSATVSEAAPPAIMTGVYWPRPIDGALTLAVTGNNINSAISVIKVILSR